MPQSESRTPKHARNTRKHKAQSRLRNKTEPRYSVGLPVNVARRVEQYAETADTSMSKAIATLVRLGLESQEDRKRNFFKRLRENLAGEDPKQQDRMIDEFRALILGH